MVGRANWPALPEDGEAGLKDNILRDVAEATSLREGVAGVEALLRAVHRNESGRLADAAREARLAIPIATAIRRELEKRGILMRQHGLAFTAEGEQWMRETLGFNATLSIDVPVTPQARLGPQPGQVVLALG